MLIFIRFKYIKVRGQLDIITPYSFTIKRTTIYILGIPVFSFDKAINI